MRYANRLTVSKEFTLDMEHAELKKALLKQYEDLLDHIYIKEGSIANRDFKIKMYLVPTALVYWSDIISDTLEENEDEQD